MGAGPNETSALSERITETARWLETYHPSGVHMEGTAVAAMVEVFEIFATDARAIEERAAALSGMLADALEERRRSWDAEDAQERELEDRVVEEACRDGSNILLFLRGLERNRIVPGDVLRGRRAAVSGPEDAA